jgi:hypothetical protein
MFQAHTYSSERHVNTGSYAPGKLLKFLPISLVMLGIDKLRPLDPVLNLDHVYTCVITGSCERVFAIDLCKKNFSYIIHKICLGDVFRVQSHVPRKEFM